MPQPPTLDYEAICIDTCIFEAHAMAFEKGLLKQLDQFATGPVALLIPEVVHLELERHLHERIQNARAKVSRALRLASDDLLVGEESLRQIEQVMLRNDTEKLGPGRLRDFYQRTDAHIIGSENASIEHLVRMYFSAEPPFEGSGKKKSEFPDAIALLSVEQWAAANRCKVLVVSTDQGWRDFCKRSDRLDIVSALGDALAHFHPHNVATALVLQLRSQIVDARSSDILKAITSEIASAVERQHVTAEASSSYDLDEVYAEATYLKHEFHRDCNGDPEINLVRVSARGIVIQLKAVISCEITAEYRISVWDSFDRQHVPLGQRKVSAAHEIEADIVVSLSGAFNGGLSGVDVDQVEIELEHALELFDFGDIDPDPDEDEWDREEYAE